MPESDAAFGEIVGRELQGNSVSGQNSNAMAGRKDGQGFHQVPAFRGGVFPSPLPTLLQLPS